MGKPHSGGTARRALHAREAKRMNATAREIFECMLPTTQLADLCARRSIDLPYGDSRTEISIALAAAGYTKSRICRVFS